jgi:hypothetical protein
MRLIRHIVILAAVLLLTASCGGKKDEVIPRGKLAQIYAEMLVLDQWITEKPSNRRVADTSLVYEPIFEKYGYTSADYRRSVDEYMNDPERYSRILRTTGEILERKLTELEILRTEQERAEARKKFLESLKITVEVNYGEYFPYLDDEPYVHYYDSLSVEPDTMWVYRLKNTDRGDTIYRDLRMVILDTLNVRDTVVRADTVMVNDTIMKQ